MSKTCPKCGLFNPSEAERCDCGYDFVTQEVRTSYLLVNEVEKQGGLERLLSAQARRNIISGVALLGFGAFVAGMSIVGQYHDTALGRASGAVVIPWLPVAGGIILLLRGLKQRTAARRVRGEQK